MPAVVGAKATSIEQVPPLPTVALLQPSLLMVKSSPSVIATDATDIDAVTDRFLFGTYAEGSTDCNLDGGTNSGDVNCVVEEL